MKKQIILIVLILTSNIIFAQDLMKLKHRLQGKWLRTEVTTKDKRFKLEADNEYNRRYYAMKFSGSDIEICNTPYEVSDRFEFRIEGRDLIYQFDRKNVAILNDSVLILEDIVDYNSTGIVPLRYKFYRQKFLIRNTNFATHQNRVHVKDSLIINDLVIEKEGIHITYITNNETTALNRRENFFPMPQFKEKNGFTFAQFIQKNINIKADADKKLNTATMAFMIDKKGKLMEAQIIAGENPKLNKKLLKVIKLSRSHWEAANIGEEKLNVLLIFDVRLKEAYKRKSLNERTNYIETTRKIY